MDQKNASLTVVGCGIKSVSHITVEAQVHIEKSEKVLFLVNSPLIGEWIRVQNPRAESLGTLYYSQKMRLDCYRAITSYIVEEVKKPQHVCVVLYGHPTVFAMPALDALKQLKQDHYNAWILPAVSAEDCLFADLCIDPSSHGCQSYEATGFLTRPCLFDPRCHLILWQVGVIGCFHHPEGFDNKKGLTVLRDYLAKHYGLEHEVILYEAATFPHDKPRIERLALKDLAQAYFSEISTLYVPPLSRIACDPHMVLQLGL